MKKLLRITALVILILIGCILFLRFVLFPIVPIDHLYDEIPDDADFVILIDTDEILSLTLSEFLSSPGEGNPFDDDEEEDDEKDVYNIGKILRKGLWNGLEIPEQFVLYQNDITDQPLIALLPLSDSPEFQSYLEEIQERTTLEEKSPGLWSDSIHTLQIGEDYLRLCIGIAEPTRDLVQEQGNWGYRLKFNPEGALLTCYRKESEHLLDVATLVSDKGNLRLAYESGSTLPFQSTGQSTHAKAWFSLRVGPGEVERSELLQNKTQLSKVLTKVGLDPVALDSIWDGQFELCIQGLDVVQEEIVSYSFNDDFEKVEQRELKERIEADFNAFLGLKEHSDSLFHRKSWVKNIDGQDLFVSYPLQEVAFEEQEGRVRFSSMDAEPRDCIDSPGDGRFLSVDIAALESDWNLTADPLSQLNLRLDALTADIATSGKSMTINLEFQDADRQGLFSLIDSPLLKDGLFNTAPR